MVERKKHSHAKGPIQHQIKLRQRIEFFYLLWQLNIDPKKNSYKYNVENKEPDHGST